MKNLAIIPARGGSKRLPNKNIMLLNSKPLIAYTIDAALNSGCFDEVMLSTDSAEYGEIGRSYGASVPFMRSAKNAADQSDTWDMVREVLGNYEKNNIFFDTVCLLQPTSPLRNAGDILSAYKIFKDKHALSVVSVCQTECPISWCGPLPEGLRMDDFFEETACFDGKEHYRLNGAIYLADVSARLRDPDIYMERCFAYVMPRERSLDIDDEFDFKLAQAYLKVLESECILNA